MYPPLTRLVLSLVVTLSGCQLLIGIDDTDPRTLAVGISAEGLDAPVVVRLQSGDVDETITLTADGPATFTSLVAAGHVYAVSIAGSPTCFVGATAAGVATTDVSVDLACAGATQLTALTLDTLTGAQPVLAAGTLAYDVAVSELQQVTRVTATARSPHATITVQGEPVSAGMPSGEIALGGGSNTVTVVVEHPASTSLRTTYTLGVARSRTLAHAVYGKAFPTSNDVFGYALATDGARIITGAVHDATATDPSNLVDTSQPSSGAAHIFVRSGATWVREDSLKAPNAEGTTLFTDGDLFGYAVGISGDYAVIGAPFEDSGSSNLSDNSTHDAGAAYVFRRSGADWVFDQYLKSTAPKANGWFGYSVAIDGDTIAVGAPRENGPGNTGGGQVFVYRRSGTAWTLEQTLQANPTTADGDGLGYAVALQGDTIVAGAIAGHPTVASAGSVRVFERQATTWTAKADLIPTAGAFTNDFFGCAVAVDHATIVIGAEAPIAGAGAGSAFVFERGATGWGQVQKLVPSNPSDNDLFGRAVSVRGDLVAIGAFHEDGAGVGVAAPDTANGATDSGAAYLYRKTSSWPASESRYVKSFAPTAGDEFGQSVALGPDFLAIGADAEDGSSTISPNEGASNSGAFYVFQ